MCVCVGTRARTRACVPPEEAAARGRSIDPKETARGGGRWGQTPSLPCARARARTQTHTHTHIPQSDTSHRASQAGRRLRDPREAAPPSAARRRGRGSGGNPRSRSPVRGPRAHTGPETPSQTLVGAHAHPLPSPAASPPAASRPDDGSLQIPGLRAPRTAPSPGGLSRGERGSALGGRADGAEPSRAGRAAPCRALRGVPRRPPAPAPGHEPLRGSALSPRPAPRPRTRRRLPGSRSPLRWVSDSPAFGCGTPQRPEAGTFLPCSFPQLLGRLSGWGGGRGPSRASGCVEKLDWGGGVASGAGTARCHREPRPPPFLCSHLGLPSTPHPPHQTCTPTACAVLRTGDACRCGHRLGPSLPPWGFLTQV